MRKAFLGTALSVLAFASLASGQESVHAPFNADAALNVDFEGKAWEGAGKIEGFHKMGSSLNVMGLNMNEEAKQKSTVYLTRNEEALFFGFDFHDSAPADFENGSSSTGDWPKGDKVEIYLDGDRAGEGKYYHFAYNASGVRAESLDTKVVKVGEWEVVNKVESDGWRSAIRIPYTTLGIQKAAKALRGLFFRDYHPSTPKAEGAERATWGGSPLHDPSAFGEIKLLQEGEVAP